MQHNSNPVPQVNPGAQALAQLIGLVAAIDERGGGMPDALGTPLVETARANLAELVPELARSESAQAAVLELVSAAQESPATARQNNAAFEALTGMELITA